MADKDDLLLPLKQTFWTVLLHKLTEREVPSDMERCFFLFQQENMSSMTGNRLRATCN